MIYHGTTCGYLIPSWEAIWLTHYSGEAIKMKPRTFNRLHTKKTKTMHTAVPMVTCSLEHLMDGAILKTPIDLWNITVRSWVWEYGSCHLVFWSQKRSYLDKMTKTVTCNFCCNFDILICRDWLAFETRNHSFWQCGIGFLQPQRLPLSRSTQQHRLWIITQAVLIQVSADT